MHHATVHRDQRVESSLDRFSQQFAVLNPGPSGSTALIPPDVPANRAAIASPDFHPEEDASRRQRVRAAALLQGER